MGLIATYHESPAFRQAFARCTAFVVRHDGRTPRQVYADLARDCERLGIEHWDVMAEGGAVTRLEDAVRGLLGTAAAAVFPSGVMAQQAALRVHADDTGSRRVAVPDLSHLLVHEEDGPRILQGLRFEHLTTGWETPAARHLDAIPGRLAAAVVELPLRDGGSILPSYADLERLAAACRGRGVRLHLDGARIWESQAWFGRPLADVVALADSVYISLYKGLGGLSGAVLAGRADFIGQARLWRRRLGGTLYRTTDAVAGLAGLERMLPRLPDTVRWARALAAALPPEVRVFPAVPHTSSFVLFADRDPSSVNARLVAHMAATGTALTRSWRSYDGSGVAMTELTVGIGALDLDPHEVARSIAAAVVGPPPS